MATLIVPRLAPAAESATPIWLLPQALSLEAPLVAALWLWFFAHSFAAKFRPVEVLVMAAVVWVIYVVDHLLDIRANDVASFRHRFVERHRRALIVGASFVLALATACLADLPHRIIVSGSALSLLVLGYFGVVHVGGKRFHILWPKELVMGLLFAAGCSIPLWPRFAHLWPGVALFALLCSLNCASLDYWEWQSQREPARTPHVISSFLARHLRSLAVLVAIISSLLFLLTSNSMFFAMALSSVALITVNGVRHSLRIETARLLADAALLTPLLFLVK